ncbi:MAG: LuxR C-terminal-related transcriptional regulator [Dehalococcoidia bacterium]
MEAPDIRYTTTKDGVRIAYGLYPGHGAPVLVAGPPGETNFARLHRNPAIAAMDDEELAGRRAVRFDWRGMGLSGPLTPPISVAHQAMDLEAVCEAVGEPVDLISWCRACFPAVTLAVARPELFRLLVLAAPDYEGSDSANASLYAIRAAMDDLEWRELKVRRDQDLPGVYAHAVARHWQREVPREVFDAHHDASMAGSLVELAPRLTVPTVVLTGVVLTGERGRRQAEAVASAIPSARLHFGEGSGVSAQTGRALREARELASGQAAPSANGKVPDSITGRELEVLVRLATGASNADMAMELQLSERTVECHVSNIYAKIGAHNRVEAANWAREHGVG